MTVLEETMTMAFRNSDAFFSHMQEVSFCQELTRYEIGDVRVFERGVGVGGVLSLRRRLFRTLRNRSRHFQILDFFTAFVPHDSANIVPTLANYLLLTI
jgi:hypothetical protein